MKHKILNQKNKIIIGIDEAGRGPLAGPVIAVAVCIKNLESRIWNFEIKDSKKLSQKRREEIFETLKNDPRVLWGRGMVSAKVIDKINIWEATKLAAKRAIFNLEKKMGKKLPKKKTLLIIDGNLKIDSGFCEKPIIKADQKIPECILASIFAKVIRDRVMERYDKIYPYYNFKKHKGYPTKEHKRLIKKYGACKIHRRSFKGVKEVIE